MITVTLPIAALATLISLISLILNFYQFITGRQKDKLLIHPLRTLVTNAGNLAHDCEKGEVKSVKEAGRRAGELGNLANAVLSAIEAKSDIVLLFEWFKALLRKQER